MRESKVTHRHQVAAVAVVEAVGLIASVYLLFVAFIFLPPGVGGGSPYWSNQAAIGYLAFIASILSPSAGFLYAASIWRNRQWLYRAIGPILLMIILWTTYFIAFPR